ncbi:hypothetical protein BV25DRAFT_1922219 [Artomyces pyxidatus]|uniref:Uncharacterized protein n=1 Tax=Artomyces pyxidatus TaxID=48021 RepID=A0ACB8SGQ5_9AGAM|nr:hypothetical protein BV25DRAFT_1922219 [Artomyces pyxidatus]
MRKGAPILRVVSNMPVWVKIRTVTLEQLIGQPGGRAPGRSSRGDVRIASTNHGAISIVTVCIL